MQQPFLSILIQKTNTPLPEAQLVVTETVDSWIIANHTVQATIKKRSAYPGTFCRQESAHAVTIGYGSEHNDEFLTIAINANGDVAVSRDAFAVLPLFYYEDESLFALANEYATVVRTIARPQIRTDVVADHLMMIDRPTPPPIQGVNILQERERLHFTKRTGVAVTQAPPRAWIYSTDAPATDPKAFFADFSQHLDYFIDTRFAGQKVAFELSGGLDSATLPQYFYRQTGEPIYAATMLFDEPYKMSQRQKLQAFADVTPLVHVARQLDPHTMAPLSGITWPSYGEATYYEATTPLVRQFREHGVQVFVTGDGGDELFHNVTDRSFGMLHGDQALRARQATQLPQFFTDTFRAAFLDATPESPLLSHRPANAMHGLFTNNLYIRENIWPVSPFMDAKLYIYTQGLPAHFRANKNILRAFHAAKGFVPTIYDTSENEYFDTFFNQCFALGVYDDAIDELMSSAATVAMGYVDPNKLRETYHHAKRHPDTEQETLFRIYCLLALEQSLRFACAIP